MVDNQNLLRKFIDENKISIYDVVNVSEWKQKAFLDNHLLRNYNLDRQSHFCIDYFKSNSWKFRELEENITEYKYVIISESNSKEEYFSIGFKSMIYLKAWISELNYSIPRYLIIDGKMSNHQFEKTIKYDIKDVEE